MSSPGKQRDQRQLFLETIVYSADSCCFWAARERPVHFCVGIPCPALLTFYKNSGVKLINKTSACFWIASRRHISANIFQTQRATEKTAKIKLRSVPHIPSICSIRTVKNTPRLLIRCHRPTYTTLREHRDFVTLKDNIRNTIIKGK